MKSSILLSLSLGLAGFLALANIVSGAPEKKPVTIQVLFDRGLEDKTEDQKNQINQLSDYFEKDFCELFAKADGFSVMRVTSRDQFDPASGQYLLTVKTVRYNPGSKAARMMVGLGAGATSLDVHYELFGADAQPIVAKDHGRGSSRDWKYVCKALNKDLLAAVKTALAGRSEPAK